MTATQELKEQVESLPEPLAREVLDFLLYVADRHRKVSAMPPQSSLRGSLANWADLNKVEQEAKAWERAGLDKHASN